MFSAAFLEAHRNGPCYRGPNVIKGQFTKNYRKTTITRMCNFPGRLDLTVRSIIYFGTILCVSESEQTCRPFSAFHTCLCHKNIISLSINKMQFRSKLNILSPIFNWLLFNKLYSSFFFLIGIKMVHNILPYFNVLIYHHDIFFFHR